MGYGGISPIGVIVYLLSAAVTFALAFVAYKVAGKKPIDIRVIIYVVFGIIYASFSSLLTMIAMGKSDSLGSNLIIACIQFMVALGIISFVAKKINFFRQKQAKPVPDQTKQIKTFPDQTLNRVSSDEMLRLKGLASHAKQETTTKPSDSAYAIAWDEVENGIQEKGLWSRIYVENDGDIKRTKIEYIKERVKQLND